MNNVGHFMTRPTPFEKLTDEQFDRHLPGRTSARLLVTRLMLPLLRAAGPGASIVNISSIEGFRGIPQFAALRRVQGRDHRLHPEPCTRAWAGGYPGQRRRTGDHRQCPGAAGSNDSRVSTAPHPRVDSLGPVRQPVGYRWLRVVPGESTGRWVSGTVIHADGGALAAAGWYRDDQGAWTNMPVIKGNSLHEARG